MSELKLKITDLILDHENPRISNVEGQQDALQKIVREQKTKLVKLAQSIVNHGLNPMDRLLVLRVQSRPPKFIALEGNRRVASLRILSNPAVLTGLEMPEATRKVLEREAKNFSKSKVEPIPCFELQTRQEGDYWLKLRHKGAQQGAGVVDWTSGASMRFGERPPVIQAFDMVTERGGLSSEHLSAINERFPMSTLKRFVDDRRVREVLGLDVKKGKLMTKLPASEVLKPLKRIVTDLATKKVRVNTLYKTEQMLEYIGTFEKRDLPDLSKTKKHVRTVDDIPASEFTKPTQTATRRKPDSSDRKTVVPKNCQIHVTDNRAADIYKELRTLPLEGAPNAIAVLLRVFLEISVDHFLENNRVKLKKPRNGGGEIYKSLDEKLAETVDLLVKAGVPRDTFASVIRALNVKTSPLYVDLLHSYVHSRFSTPATTDLKAAWDIAQHLLEKIWPA